jgi:hypothetical protein
VAQRGEDEALDAADQLVRDLDPLLVIRRVGLREMKQGDLQPLGGGVERGGAGAQRPEVQSAGRVPRASVGSPRRANGSRSANGGAAVQRGRARSPSRNAASAKWRRWTSGQPVSPGMRAASCSVT